MNTANTKTGRIGIVFFVTLAIMISFFAWNATGNTGRTFSGMSTEKREPIMTADGKLWNATHHFNGYLLRVGDYDKRFSADFADVNATAAGNASMASVSNRERSLPDTISKGTETTLPASYKVVEVKFGGAQSK
jgi:hypothetical protein